MKQTYYDEKSPLTYMSLIVFASWGFSTHDCFRKMAFGFGLLEVLSIIAAFGLVDPI